MARVHSTLDWRLNTRCNQPSLKICGVAPLIAMMAPSEKRPGYSPKMIESSILRCPRTKCWVASRGTPRRTADRAHLPTLERNLEAVQGRNLGMRREQGRAGNRRLAHRDGKDVEGPGNGTRGIPAGDDHASHAARANERMTAAASNGSHAVSRR